MKKVLISFAVLAISAAAIIAVNANNRMDEQFEANVEALAGGEDIIEICDSWCRNSYSYVCTLITSAGYNIYCVDMYPRY